MASGNQEHILVVDDDPKIRQLLRRCFEPEGYVVSEAGNGDEMMRLLEDADFNLITLDLSMPGEDGFSIARRVRETSRIPIIMVTGKGETIDRVVGLEIGADDYIAKPFHVREVLARVRSVLRRADNTIAVHSAGPDAADEGCALTFGDWEVDLGMRELRKHDGTRQDLTTAEFNLLELFARHPKQVLSRDRIMNLLNGRDWTPYDRAIDTQIARLRKKIEFDPSHPNMIKTVRGIGYVFTAELERRGS
jgi:two-component system phosphate regulon response regulator OmpR